MTETTHLSLPFIDAAQAQKHVTHNEALQLLDAVVHLSVSARNQSAPPLSPTEGQRFLVGPGATGAFAGKDLQIASFIAGAWTFLVPRAGWRLYVETEQLLFVYDGAVWNDAGLTLRALQNLDHFGLGAVADAANPLSAKLNSALLTAKSVGEGGSGDLRVALNKSVASNTVSQLYQDNFSGRAETGLTGDDHFHVKVSADGTTWKEAINIDPASGIANFPNGTSGITTGQANGVAALDVSAKVPLAQLPAALVGALQFQGTWNAASNAPALASGIGTKGFFYKVSVAGTTTIDGLAQWNVGDLILFDGTVWDKIDGSASEVLSVAGRTGAVALSAADVVGLAAVATSGSAADLASGTLPAARLPVPSATALGGVQSLSPVASKWINSISTAGVPGAAQPAFADLAGQASPAQLPTIANNTLLGNASGGAATPSALSAPVASSFGFAGATSGVATVQPQAVAGTPTLTLPNASGTFAVAAASPLALNAATGNLTLGIGAGLALANGNLVFGDGAGVVYDATNRALTLTGGVLSGATSYPALSATQTWNNGATAFTALDLNVTDAASSVSSLLFSLRVGGANKFLVGKNGNIAINGAAIDQNTGFASSLNLNDPAADNTAASFSRTLVLGGVNSHNITGGFFNISTGANAFNATGTLRGSNSQIQNSNTATVSTAYAGDFLLYNVGAGTITTGAAVNATLQNLNAAGNINNA